MLWLADPKALEVFLVEPRHLLPVDVEFTWLCGCHGVVCEYSEVVGVAESINGYILCDLFYLLCFEVDLVDAAERDLACEEVYLGAIPAPDWPWVWCSHA